MGGDVVLDVLIHSGEIPAVIVWSAGLKTRYLEPDAENVRIDDDDGFRGGHGLSRRG